MKLFSKIKNAEQGKQYPLSWIRIMEKDLYRDYLIFFPLWHIIPKWYDINIDKFRYNQWCMPYIMFRARPWYIEIFYGVQSFGEFEP